MTKTFKETQGEFAALLQEEFSLSDDDMPLITLLSALFPQPELLPCGGHYYTPDEVKYFDALFERFGLEMRSSDDRFDDINYLPELWYRLVNRVGSYITAAGPLPKIVERRLAQMPAGFREYIAAVSAGDRPAAQRLAKQLDIENLDAFCINGLFG